MSRNTCEHALQWMEEDMRKGHNASCIYFEDGKFRFPLIMLGHDRAFEACICSAEDGFDTLIDAINFAKSAGL